MPIKSCLAGIENGKVALLSTVLSDAGLPMMPSITEMHITDIAKSSPTVVVCDVDALVVDKLEQLRQLRFVLPGSTIAVYTGQLEEPWAAACHLAGANCVLSKTSSPTELSSGIRDAMRSGCFTDPRFYGRVARPIAESKR